jgi:hypothetical protein
MKDLSGMRGRQGTVREYICRKRQTAQNAMKMAFKVRKASYNGQTAIGFTDQYMNALCSDQIGWEIMQGPENYNKARQIRRLLLRNDEKYTVNRGLYGTCCAREGVVRPEGW